MHWIKNASLAITLLMLGMPVLGEEPAADDVLKKVAEKYRTMETYKAEGTIHMDADAAGRKLQLETSFTMLLKKPNLYLISWTQTGIVRQSGTVWSDGTQPYLYMGATNAYAKMDSDEMALAGATGISGGAAFTIPSMFLPVFTCGLLFRGGPGQRRTSSRPETSNAWPACCAACTRCPRQEGSSNPWPPPPVTPGK